MRLHFVQEYQFCSDVERIEAKPLQQVYLLEKIERACIDRIGKNYATGIGFVTVVWGCSLIAWYETDGVTVYLQSIRFDLRET
jgi:hypothetical protein